MLSLPGFLSETLLENVEFPRRTVGSHRTDRRDIDMLYAFLGLYRGIYPSCSGR